MQEKIKGMM